MLSTLWEDDTVKLAESVSWQDEHVSALNNIDRRESPREDTNLRARVFYGPGMAHWADCSIVDLSKGGARLQISSIYPLPPRFIVLQLQGGMAYDVRTRWRRGDMTGVAFDAQTQIANTTEERLAPARQAWEALKS